MPFIRLLLTSLIIVAVGQISDRYPKAGALLLSLPLVSILAILVGWQQHHQLRSLSTLARDTLILVPLGLPFFIPLAFAPQWGLNFWPALLIGLALATATISTYLLLTAGH